MLTVSLIGVRGKKSDKLTLPPILFYIVVGLLLFFISTLFLQLSLSETTLAQLYIAVTAVGYLSILAGGSRMSRLLYLRLGKDIFNEKNETFPQEERILSNEYSINLPAQYKLKGKTRRSWINIINPFRALLVLGTPGAGKSYFVIRHVISQHIQKGFTFFIYDYKFPDLTRIAYNTARQHTDKYAIPPKLYIINFDDLSRSHRCNLLSPESMLDITDATESSRTILLALNREWIKKRVIKNDIAPYTCQFLTQDTTKGMLPYASGVLAELGGDFYILTASHVIENWSDEHLLFIEFGNGYVSIVGKGSGTIIERDIRLDVAYIKLKDELVLILKGWYKFLPRKAILHYKKTVEDGAYCVYGYPVARHKRIDGVLRPTAVAYFVRPHPDKVYEHYNLDFLSHYVLEYQGKAINLSTGESEKMRTEHYGLSGGGLWYAEIGFDGKKLKSETFLIGIMTEFRKGKYECLIANRIEILLAAIKRDEGKRVL